MSVTEMIIEKESPICCWKWDEGFWVSDCGEAFEFNDGNPSDNGFQFCPYCGKLLEEI